MLSALAKERERECKLRRPGGQMETFTSQQEVAVGTDKGELLQSLISSVYDGCGSGDKSLFQEMRRVPGQREMRVPRVPVIQEVGRPQDMHGNYPTWVSLVSQGHHKKEKPGLVESQDPESSAGEPSSHYR